MIKETKDCMAIKEATDIMLSNITGIRLTGGNFTSPTDLSFFNTNQKQAIIIYGKNGAGKSTIAKAVKAISTQSLPSTIQQAEFFDKNKKSINLSDEERERIYVFDEEFVDKNIKFHQQGLNTIVMIGQQINLEEKITAKINELQKLKESLSEQQSTIDKYDDAANSKSPAYWQNQINEALRGTDNWAGRNKKIKLGEGSNSKVNNATYKQFIDLHPKESRDTLIIEFNDKLKDLNKISHQEISDSISKPVPLPNLHYDEELIRTLLAQKIERPIVSDREKRLIALGFDQLKARKKELLNPDLKECPYCLQPLSSNYKQGLIQDIEKVLQQTVNEHQKKLIQSKHERIDLNLSAYMQLSSYNECQQLYNQLEEALQDNNEKLTKKYNDPYTPITENIAPVTGIYDQLITTLQKLEEERNNLCNKNATIECLQSNLKEINAKIAYYDIFELAKQLDKYTKESNEAHANLKKSKGELGDLQKELSDLKAQRKNITIALDLINGYLRYIFFTGDRLKIVVQNNFYVLLSNGKQVSPSQISTGERNIIALCYYFAHIMQGQAPEKARQNDYLLVIDDPVSSFDINNRVGITSFLALQLRKFLKGNFSTRAIILTHSLQVYYDMKQTMEDLLGKKAAGKAGFELVNQQLQLIPDDQKRYEYSKLILTIFNYANGIPDILTSYDLSIGNMMRQVLEAFSTFQYRKGIRKIATDSDILKVLDKHKVSTYFENLMYQLILHGESHTEIKVKTMQNMEFLSSFSQEEKMNMAKSVLCLIYLLEPLHLLTHLQAENDLEKKNTSQNEETPNFKETLEKWCDEIRKETPPNP